MLKKFFATNAGCGVFWIRLPLGIAMMMHGYGKFTNMQGFIDFCDNIGIPPFFAVLGACGEFLGGLGVLLGCLSRIAAFGIACTMATAAVSRHLIPGYGYEMTGTARCRLARKATNTTPSPSAWGWPSCSLAPVPSRWITTLRAGCPTSGNATSSRKPYR